MTVCLNLQAPLPDGIPDGFLVFLELCIAGLDFKKGDGVHTAGARMAVEGNVIHRGEKGTAIGKLELKARGGGKDFFQNLPKVDGLGDGFQHDRLVADFQRKLGTFLPLFVQFSGELCKFALEEGFLLEEPFFPGLEVPVDRRREGLADIKDFRVF